MSKIKEARVMVNVEGNRVGYAGCVLETDDGLLLRLDGMVVYVVEGKPAIAYPKHDKVKDLAYWNPLNRETAKMIESAVFEQISRIKDITFED